MTSPTSQEPHFLQTFKSQNDRPLLSRPTHLCAETGKRYVLWSDIQKAFPNIKYLQEDWSKERVLFMINKCGKLCLPLRIEYNGDETFVVVMQVANQNELACIVDECEHLYERLENGLKMARALFQQIAANTLHHHDSLKRTIAERGTAPSNTHVGGRNLDEIQEKLIKLEQKVPDWNHQNIHYNMFHSVQTKWDYATSKLFIVLPSDDESWDDTDRSTHHFRLYFLCDNRKDDPMPTSMPQNVHFANHPGYNLLRPQEFLEKYGDYVLRILRMVKNGYDIGSYEIPPLHSAKIFWNFEHSAQGRHVNEANIVSLVDKAISYIEKLSLQKWTMEPGMTQTQSAAIKEYLSLQPGENTEGDLHRHIESDQRVTWRCVDHKQQYFISNRPKALTTFVQSHEGSIDMQQASVRAVLHSSAKADTFRNLLKNTKPIFNLTIKLDLKAPRSYLRDFCLDVARSGAVTLEVEGVALESHPPGYVEYSNNLFAAKVIPDCELKLITLVNYPRPKEQCLHLGKISLQTPMSPSTRARSWVELKTDLEKIHSLVSLANVAAECDKATTVMQSVLEKHGYPKTTLVTIHESGWDTVFSPQDGGVVEIYSQDAACPKGVYASGSIRKMTVDLSELEFDSHFFNLVKTNASLRELNVSYRGHSVIYYIESIVKMWHESSSPFRLTLIDRLEDSRGRVVAQMNIRGCGSDRSSDSTLEVDRTDSTSSSTQGDEPVAPAKVEFSQWDCDQLSAQPSDYSALILDKATEKHPEALNSLTLDCSQLSSSGLSSVTNLLGRSEVDHLNIVCNPFDAGSFRDIAQLLDSAQCDMLKSLIFSGSNIDGWIKLWPPAGSPKLIQLRIHGPASIHQELSHQSVLAIHQMAYASPLIELGFTNVELQDPRDWELITGALDPQSIKRFDVCDRAKAQIESCPEAVGILNARFPERHSPKAPFSTISIISGPVVKDVASEKPSARMPAEPYAKSEKTGSTVQDEKKAVSEPSFWRRLCCCCCGGGRK